MSGIYSDEIEKICRVCEYSKNVKGVNDYVLCSADGGYYRLNHTCARFRYDIMKKPVRRKKEFVSKFTAEDFKL